jgi:hypothetical protein
MGRLSSATLFSFESKKCACSLFAKEKNSKCCHDTSELVKVESDHAAGSVLLVPDAVADWVSVVRISLFTSENASSNRLASPTMNKRPPPVVPLYTLYSSLRFFDDAAA